MRNIKSVIFRTLTYISIALTIFMMLAIVIYIFAGGLKHITPELLFGDFSSENPSMKFAIITTVILVALSLIISVPIGVGCAIYLTEYAKSGSRVVRLIRLATETLAGIPSIIYGLFGALFFGTALGMGYSILSGVLTISIMVLPTIIRTSEEAIKSVPMLYREGSFGLGAGKLRTIIKIVLPSAANGIFSAIMLSVGRMVGETAALIFTLGSVAEMPTSIMDSSRTLAVHMYISTRDGGMVGRNVAFATGTVLIIIVILINIFTLYLSRRAGKMNEN